MPAESDDKRRKWLEAARQLATNRFVQVLCPTCGLAFLQTEDEKIGDDHIDRHMRCHNCGAHEVIFKRVKRNQ